MFPHAGDVAAGQNISPQLQAFMGCPALRLELRHHSLTLCYYLALKCPQHGEMRAASPGAVVAGSKPPTSGCKPVPSQFESACSILANGTCPTGYQRSWKCGPTRTSPCRRICLLPNDADYVNRPIRGCRPYSYSGVEGCNTLLNGGCPTGYHGIFVEPPQPVSRGVRGRDMCVIDKK